MTALIAFLAKPAGKVAFWAVLALLVSGVIGGAWIAVAKHYEAIGVRDEKDRQHNADMAWLKDAQSIAGDEHAKAVAKGAELDKSKQDMTHAEQEIARLSAANDRRACWNLATVRRLRQLGAAQQRGGATGVQPGGPAGAGGARR